MTAPRAVHPGTTYLLGRRATRRYFLFRPDRDGTMQQILLYALAVAARDYGIEVHGLAAMSSHLHEVLSDPLGVLPAFLHECRRLQANATKCHRGWPEEVFNKTGNSKVELLSAEAVLKELAYVIANPVAAGAVMTAGQWPGLITMPEDIGTKVLRVRRPEVYFDPDNERWPEEIELPITMPHVLLDAYGLEGAQQRIAERVRELEAEAHVEARRRGWRFGTRRSALRTKITRRASSFELFGALSPTFAAAGDKALAKAATARKRLFEAEYALCLERWRQGDRSVVWPPGTWKMHVLHGCRCHAPP